MAVLAFDMGGTSVKHAVWIENELKDASSFKTPSTWDAMKDSMKAVFDEKKDIVGIAISAPGSVDVETGSLNFTVGSVLFITFGSDIVFISVLLYIVGCFLKLPIGTKYIMIVTINIEIKHDFI